MKIKGIYRNCYDKINISHVSDGFINVFRLDDKQTNNQKREKKLDISVNSTFH